MAKEPKIIDAEFTVVERTDRTTRLSWWSISLHTILTLLLAGAASVSDSGTERFAFALLASGQWPLARLAGDIIRGGAENEIVSGGRVYWNKQTLWILTIIGILGVVKVLLTGSLLGY